MTKDTVKALLQRPVAFNPAFAKIAGSVKAGLFLSQLFYWDGKGNDEEGWIFKTQKEWTEETCLSVDEQESARKRLKEKGYIEEKRAGNPARLYYRICLDKISEDLEARNKTPENPETSIGETPNLESEKPSNKTTETHETILRDYPENTTQTTASEPTPEDLNLVLKAFSHALFLGTGRLYRYGRRERDHMREIMRDYQLSCEQVCEYFALLPDLWKSEDQRFWPKTVLRFDGARMAQLETVIQEQKIQAANKEREMQEAGYVRDDSGKWVPARQKAS
jgi:hypothetical protein